MQIFKLCWSQVTYNEENGYEIYIKKKLEKNKQTTVKIIMMVKKTREKFWEIEGKCFLNNKNEVM